MFDYSAVNWLAVVVAAVANIVINTVWYLPALFGKRWGALTGRDLTAQPAPANYVVAIVGALISAYVLALLVHATGAGSIADGALLGLIVWLGTLATTTAVGGMFEGRSWSLWGINAGASAIAFAVMGGVLGALR